MNNRSGFDTEFAVATIVAIVNNFSGVCFTFNTIMTDSQKTGNKL